MDGSSDSRHPDFWSGRYAAGTMPWDFGGVPAALKSFLPRSSGKRKVLIPGCGSGYEVQAFHEAGYDVSAIDFSPAAVERAKKVLGDLAGCVVLGDFFTYKFGRRFDLIYERTFMCSMAADRWPDYVARVSELLSAEGRLIGFFLYGQAATLGPPFAISESESQRLFQSRFRLLRNDPVTDSLPLFRGRESWQEWLKIDCG